MSGVKITTDWHIGVSRTGGTTTESLAALRAYLRSSLAAQLGNEDHIIAGDLFDSFTIDTAELVSTFNIFSEWLKRSGKTLVLLRGNHDYHQSAWKVSSFDLLGHVLSSGFPDQVVIADQPCTWRQFILVPHMANQDIFQMEINKIISSGVSDKVIVVHANVDNPYAAESQHGLNITRDTLEALCEKNVVVCGHEHQHRVLNDHACVVLGNGAPSSIADCLGPDRKYAALFHGTSYTLRPIWFRENEYCEMNWREINENSAKFIRVVGNASMNESADVVNAVSRLRQLSKAFVTANAVAVEGMQQFEQLEAASLESVKAFDVIGAIMQELTETERIVVKGLLDAPKN